jgi:glycyl-tRNA synthetase
MAASASTANPSTLAVPLNKTAHAFDKGQLDAMLSRRFFYAPAFEIYGGELDYTGKQGLS